MTLSPPRQIPRTANEPKDITLSIHRIEVERQCPEKFNGKQDRSHDGAKLNDQEGKLYGV